MRIAALATLRPQFEHLYPIVDALRVRGHDVDVYSTWRNGDLGEWQPENVIRQLPVDLWLVASASDADIVRDRPVVFVERGTGQTYDADKRTADSPSWSSGFITNAQLFLCPNRFVSARRQRLHPNALAIVVGCPRLDAFAHLVGMHEGVDDITVALAFGWERPAIPETRGAFEHYRPHLRDIARGLASHGLRPVVTAHPRISQRVRNHACRNGWEWWNGDDVLEKARLLIADNTSLMYEFAALDRPVVCLDAPWWRRDVHHGLRFWECIPGYCTARPADVVDLVVESLRHDWHEARDCVGKLYPVLDGKAAQRSAEAIGLLL